MKLNHLLPAENIKISIQAESRRDVLLQLMDPLVKGGIITDPEKFADDLEEREEQVTTQVENNVALPHARSMTVKRLGLTVGTVSEPGLDFGPDPDRPCRLFFLIAIPEFAPTAHLPLLRTLASFAHDKKRCRKLVSCKTEKQILKQLNGFKG